MNRTVKNIEKFFGNTVCNYQFFKACSPRLSVRFFLFCIAVLSKNYAKKSLENTNRKLKKLGKSNFKFPLFVTFIILIASFRSIKIVVYLKSINLNHFVYNHTLCKCSYLILTFPATAP